jgi:two-component SAPR family response regulator
MNFIVIDDSKLDCFIAEKIIRNTQNCMSVKTFLQASDALDFIARNRAERDTVVLVDIQMPIMNGFDFVEAFEKMDPGTTKNYNIYIISSSINENDVMRVQKYSSVRQFINKPLTTTNLNNLLGALQAPPFN